MMSTRKGFTFIEVMVVALIAGTAMVFLMSLGQANVQLSQINQESLLARQVAMDLLEYYAHNNPEAFLIASPEPLPADFFVRHPAFSDTLALSPQLSDLWKKMNPTIVLDMEANIMVETTGVGHPDLHRLSCSVKWQEGGGKTAPKVLSLSKLVATFR